MSNTTREPSLGEVIRKAIDARLMDVHTCTVARVQSYDSEKQVADLVPVMRRPYNIGEGVHDFEDLPVLINVPVKHRRGAGFYEHFPLKKGDHVVVIFTDTSIAMWRETGDLADPDDLRRHSLGSAIAISGIDTEFLTDVPNEGFPDDEVVLGGGTFRFGRLNAADYVALASLVDHRIAQLVAAHNALVSVVAALSTTYGSHTHPIPGPATSSAPNQAPGTAPTPLDPQLPTACVNVKASMPAGLLVGPTAPPKIPGEGD